MHKVQDNPGQALEVFKFFAWAYANGGKMAEDLVYVPMPASVVKLIREFVETDKDGKWGSCMD